MAASGAQIDYDTDGLDPPILTVEEAVKQSSFFDVPPFLDPQQVGDFSKGMAEADHKILSAEVLITLCCLRCFWGVLVRSIAIFFLYRIFFRNMHALILTARQNATALMYNAVVMASQLLKLSSLCQ